MLTANCSVCGKAVNFQLPVNTDCRYALKEDDHYSLWDVVEERLEPSKAEIEALRPKASNYIISGLEIRSRILEY